MKFHIRTGDEVQVVRGRQTGRRTPAGEGPLVGRGGANPVGERGRVRKVLRKEGRVIVDRIRMQTKTVRPDPRKGVRGGFTQREAAVPISSVMLVCKRCDRPVRVGVKVNEDGKKVRLCRRCGGEM